MSRPDELDPPDDRLADYLGAYDDAVARGGDAPPPGDADVPSDLREQLKQAKETVDLLNQLWPKPAPRDTVADGFRSTADADSGPERATAPMDGPLPSPAPDPTPPRQDAAFRLPGFLILEEVGRGGMGVVYRALQLSLNREVAVKRLPPHLAEDPSRLRRFRNEARLAASLTDSNILPVFDVLDVDGVPLMVMPFVEGSDLARIVADRRAFKQGAAGARKPLHPWATLGDADYLREVLGVLDRVVDAVAVIHGKSVFHRDIKPSNVMVASDGNVWLTDFGLARSGRAESTLTVAGAQLGSPGFMSPEQWAGVTEPDERVDVFGLGSTIYQVVTLKLPYGTARIDRKVPLAAPPRSLQPALRADYNTVILGALEPDRDDRYFSGAELRDDWYRVRQGLPPRRARVGWTGRAIRRVRNHHWGIADAVTACLILGVMGLAWKVRALPPPAPPRPTPPAFTRTVLVNTEPQGARVVLVPVSVETGDPDPARAVRPAATTPVTLNDVPPGDYLIVATVDRFGWFHEVFRHVPGESDFAPAYRYTAGPMTSSPSYNWTLKSDGTCLLPTINIPKNFDTTPLARFEGSPNFPLGDTDPSVGLPAHPVRVEPFFLETTEVTAGAHQRVMGGLPAPMGRAVKSSDPDFPVVLMTYDQALAYAEKIGMRLPTEEELEFAATGGGTRRFPWGSSDDPIRAGDQWNWPYGPVGRANPRDRTDGSPPVLGLFSNVAEWTSSWVKLYPLPAEFSGLKLSKPAGYVDLRVVKGGVPGVTEGTGPGEGVQGFVMSPHWRSTQEKQKPAPGLGFRCARSVKPRFIEGF